MLCTHRFVRGQTTEQAPCQRPAGIDRCGAGCAALGETHLNNSKPFDQKHRGLATVSRWCGRMPTNGPQRGSCNRIAGAQEPHPSVVNRCKPWIWLMESSVPSRVLRSHCRVPGLKDQLPAPAGVDEAQAGWVHSTSRSRLSACFSQLRRTHPRSTPWPSVVRTNEERLLWAGLLQASV